MLKFLCNLFFRLTFERPIMDSVSARKGMLIQVSNVISEKFQSIKWHQVHFCGDFGEEDALLMGSFRLIKCSHQVTRYPSKVDTAQIWFLDTMQKHMEERYVEYPGLLWVSCLVNVDSRPEIPVYVTPMQVFLTGVSTLA